MLITLLKTVPWLDQVLLPEQFAQATTGIQILIMDLGEYLGIDHTQLPGTTPYVFADTHRAEQLSPLFPKNKPLAIGLNWRGGPLYPGDALRSSTLMDFIPLLQCEKANFYSLTYEPDATELNAWPIPLTDLKPHLHTFADTAAMLTHLDLIITTDTALAHLAGAMNKTCWLLLSADPDWRWEEDRTDSPWYPSLRLFRQRTLGDWPSLIEDVLRELNSY